MVRYTRVKRSRGSNIIISGWLWSQPIWVLIPQLVNGHLSWYQIFSPDDILPVGAVLYQTIGSSVVILIYWLYILAFEALLRGLSCLRGVWDLYAVSVFLCIQIRRKNRWDEHMLMRISESAYVPVPGWGGSIPSSVVGQWTRWVGFVKLLCCCSIQLPRSKRLERCRR